ncbi:hypothetical protein FDP41_007087 [Naegleria fowleri]|uniref:Queuosine 5'-phosphate N-glycosylase/hydrolase n=1 Tax=Naegleria fowleri TaxID=5763 RepID=A0A6A5BI30_NAEFO|nr:uncharacterized protein FDP41_007087 [Naegleria fowleri]KAF0973700.1 hypothetical protein FDP41_007087 [Naegleria fowleri]
MNHSATMSMIDLVKKTTQHVCEQPSTHVRINSRALEKTCEIISQHIHQKLKQQQQQQIGTLTTNSTTPSLIESLFIEWDNDTLHYRNLQEPSLTCQYILVLSSINFCFWPHNDSNPNDEFEYGHLAGALRKVLTQDPNAFHALALSQLSEEKFIHEWMNGVKVPLVSERVRLIREVGSVLLEHFEGSAFHLIQSAQKGVKKLVSLITQYFPGFRDSCIYSKTGHQIHFYKRAQIFCADIYGCFRGEGIGEFEDIHELTMFADYRVPQLLSSNIHFIENMNTINATVNDMTNINDEDENVVLVYSSELKDKIARLQPLEYSSQMEVEIRAFTIQAVEQMRQILLEKHRIKCLSIEIDWMLWQIGENARKTIKPHHRTLSIYY